LEGHADSSRGRAAEHSSPLATHPLGRHHVTLRRGELATLSVPWGAWLLELLLLTKVALLDVLDAVSLLLHLHLLLRRHLVVHLTRLNRLLLTAHLPGLVALHLHGLHQLLLLLLLTHGCTAMLLGLPLLGLLLLHATAAGTTRLVLSIMLLVTLLQESCHQVGVVL